MLRKILKLANRFENETKFALIKNASISSDLAIRIMHNLIPESVNSMHEGKNIQTQLAQKHLLGVAERYMERAAKIIVEEMSYAKDRNAFKIANNAFNAKNYLSVAQIGIKEFAKDDWDVLFGGEKWRKFSEQLYNLGLTIKEFKEAVKSGDEKAKRELEGSLSIYMNILDGLTHNTGSFLDKMIANESGQVYDITGQDTYNQNRKETLELMDSKQLSNYEDVLPFIKKYMRKNPDSYLYREYFSKLMSRSKPDAERTKEELKQVRHRKKIIDYLQSNVDMFIDRMEKDAKSENFSNLKDYYGFINATARSVNLKEASDVITPILQKYDLESEFHNLFEKDVAFYNLLKNPDTLESLLYNYVMKQQKKGEYIIDYEGNYYHITCGGQYDDIQPIDLVTYSQYNLDKIYITKDDLDRVFNNGAAATRNERAKQILNSMIDCIKELRRTIVNFFDLGLADVT